MSSLALQLIEENKRTHALFLDLGNCDLITLPDELFHFDWLEELNLGDSYWVKLDSRSIESKNRVGSNRIEQRSLNKLKQLASLQSLSLRNNRINDIHFLKQLTQLRSLDLRDNRIINIYPLEQLTLLQTVDLMYNNITNLHPLEQLTRLQAINLKYNNINYIRSLEQLTCLKDLDLSFNDITNVNFLKRLTSLQTLDLSHNKIADIHFLEQLTSLQSINLNFNKINRIQENILASCLTLVKLHLANNPIDNIPKEIFDKEDKNALQDIRDYFASLKKGTIENDEVKLIVVGNTTAGKTSLTRFLQEGEYDTTQNSTHGISLKRWSVTDTNPNLQINIWDFGGQEYYHATHRLFMDDHAVYLVVWEAGTNIQGVQETPIYLSDQLHHLLLEHFPYDYWLEGIRYYAPESTILMLQTKTDKIGNGPQSVEKKYFEQPYNIQLPAYQLSVKNANDCKHNVTKTSWLEFITFETKLLEMLRKGAAKYPLGAKWVEVRDEIKRIAEDTKWLSLAEFNTLCHKIDPTIEMKGLMTYLKGSASIILHYEYDIQLSKYVFLNPQWVSSTIYDILSYDIQEKQKGEFTREHVKKILYGKGMEPMTDTFLGLMKAHQFELIFEKPNFPDIYIAPQYLPEEFNDSRALQMLRPKAAIGFTLHFPRFMPRSVFVRFMVRYGNLAEDVYWKYGIVLDKQDVRIVAECQFAERKINVAIENKSLGKQLAKELFNVLWQLSGQKLEIEVATNGTDFLEIGQLQRYLQNTRNLEIESKQGNWVAVSEFTYLFGKEITTSEPENPLPTMSVSTASTPEIFFSYAWGKTDDTREKVANNLYISLKNSDYNVIRDKVDLGYRKPISSFMERIGKGDFIVVALSDKYLKSSYCMFELYEAFRNAKLEKEALLERIFPIRTESIDLSPKGRRLYREHWKKEIAEWDEYVNDYAKEISASEQAEYERIKSIVANLGNLFEILTDINSLTIELLSQNDFAEIKKAIDKRIQSLK